MPAPGTNPDPRSDFELVDAINERDARAFDVLYMRYRDWVVALAYRFTGDKDIALDVMQETFLYLLRKFPGFVLTAQLKTFLYPVIRHLAIAAAKRARRFRQDVSDDFVLEQAAIAPAEKVDASTEDLSAVLAHLPHGQREVLWLRFVDDLPLRDIAVALELPLGTVKSRLHLALTSLRSDPRTRRYFES